MVGDLPGIRQSLAAAGIEDVSSQTSRHPADVAFASAQDADEAMATAAAVVVDGPAQTASVLRRGGLFVRRLLPLPDPVSHRLVLDVEHGLAARYALDHWNEAPTRSARLKQRLAGTLVGSGLLPPVRQRLSVGAASSRQPAVVRAAAETAAVPPEARWFASFEPGLDRKRCSFVVFEPSGDVPLALVKFARLGGPATAFENDERGLALAAAIGGSVAPRAPRLLARFELGGHQASVETAAMGTSLALVLTGPHSRRAKLALVEEVSTWLLGVARETRDRKEALEPERARLRSRVLPFWSMGPEGEALLAGLAGVPAVFEHGDLSEGNVVFGPDGFSVVDWELARRHGVPLWDLVYFALSALPLVDGAMGEADRDAHFVALFEGKAATSPVLFRWLRSAVDGLALPPDSVGPLVTLCLLNWGELRERIRLQSPSSPESAKEPLPVERAAAAWLSRPGLGRRWDRWRA